MIKMFGVWGRQLFCVLTFACLAGCNVDGSSSNGAAPQASGNENPPAAQNPIPDPTDPTPQQPANVAPQIVGSPGTEVLVGQAYSFTPNASDTDGDALMFAISSKPTWASFNTATGRLSGTPSAAHVGSYEQITIRVSDGESTQALPQFAINVVQQSNGSVTLAWQAPTENTDGSPLVNLNGYKIHYGTQSGSYATTIDVDSAGITRYVIENLSPGTYYFAITAVSGGGAQSDFSGEASKTI